MKNFVPKIKYLIYCVQCVCSWTKLINFFNLKFTYWISRFSHKIIYRAKPCFLSIEPTNLCNLHCPQCPTGMGISKAPRGFASVRLCEILANQSQLMVVNLFFQGEPFLNSDLPKMIATISSKKIFTIVSTNAHFIDDEVAKQIVASRLGKLIISFDGYDQSTYEKYRIGGNFSKVQAAIRAIIDAKRNAKSAFPFIELQTLLFSYTEANCKKFKKLARQLGADSIVFKTAQFYSDSDLLPTEPNSRYRRTSAGELVIKSNLPSACWRAWAGRVVTWNGSIVPCCFDKDWQFVYSVIDDNSVTLTNEKTLAFYKTIFATRRSMPMCCNCVEGLNL